MVFDKARVEQKISLILEHTAQLDPLFLGDQPLEFWGRAHNLICRRKNAHQLQRLGDLPSLRDFAPLYGKSFDSPTKTRAKNRHTF